MLAIGSSETSGLGMSPNGRFEFRSCVRKAVEPRHGAPTRGPASDGSPRVLQASERYLYPRFDVLEAGATPNLADIHAYLRDGIELDFVPDFRRHVPCRLSPLAPLADPALPVAPTPCALVAPTSPSVSLVKLMNRVPLLQLRSPSSPPPPPEEARRASPPGAAPAASPLPSASSWAVPAESSPAFAKPHPSLPKPRPPMLPVPPQPAALMRATSLYNAFHAPQLFRPLTPFAPVPRAYVPPMQVPYPVRASPPPAYSGASAPPGPPEPSRFAPCSDVVVLSASECQIYTLLNRVNRSAAHWYMVGAIERGRRSTLNPDAAEFHSATATTQTDILPPPGFQLP